VEEALEQYGKGGKAFVARSGGMDTAPPIRTLSPSLLGRLLRDSVLLAEVFKRGGPCFVLSGQPIIVIGLSCAFPLKIIPTLMPSLQVLPSSSPLAMKSID
jgi:hypothetical protein